MDLPHQDDFPDSFRNIAGHVLDGTLWNAGLVWTSSEIVLPLLIVSLGGSAVEIGAAPAVLALGWLLPQIFGAPFIESRPYKKPIVMWLGLLQRIPWLIAAGLLYWGYNPLGEVMIPLLLACFFLSFFLGGLAGAAWIDFIASSISVRWRGRHFGLRQVLAGAAGIVIGFLVKKILQVYPFPHNFALLFLLGFLCWSVGLACLSMVREIGGGNSQRHERLGYYFRRRIPLILSTDSNFRMFLVIKTLMVTATQLSMAFYIVCAMDRFSLPSSEAGTFITVMMCGSMIFPLVVGWVADRYGHRVNLCLGCLVILSCNLLALFGSNLLLFQLLFFILPARRGVDITSYIGISMEFSAPKDRPTYIALSNSIVAPFILFGVVGGWIRGRFGYAPLFLSSCIIVLIALFLLIFLMKDPRQKNSAPMGSIG